jgi:hypothetical protein
MGKGGTIGAIQSFDDALAAKYGIPVETVAKVRSALGIIDVRTLPGSDRVLPEGYAWTRDVLDDSNRVVNTAGYHWSAPRVIQAGNASTLPIGASDLVSGTNAAPATVDELESILRVLAPILAGNSALLEPAK